MHSSKSTVTTSMFPRLYVTFSIRNFKFQSIDLLMTDLGFNAHQPLKADMQT